MLCGHKFKYQNYLLSIVKKKVTYFVTGSKVKASIASGIMSEFGIKLVKINMETPEIQSFDGKEVCEFSAKYIAKKLKKPVVKTDVSYSIPALNGFPGAFVKFVNIWFTPNDLLKLMAGKNNRNVEITEYLCYAKPNGKVITFLHKQKGRIAEKAVENNKGSTFDKVLIREGFDVAQNLLSEEDLKQFFHENCTAWKDLGRYINKQ